MAGAASRTRWQVAVRGHLALHRWLVRRALLVGKLVRAAGLCRPWLLRCSRQRHSASVRPGGGRGGRNVEAERGVQETREAAFRVPERRHDRVVVEPAAVAVLKPLVLRALRGDVRQQRPVDLQQDWQGSRCSNAADRGPCGE